MSKRPGYKPPRTLYRLNFSQTEHAGLEVVAKGTSVNGLMELTDVGAELDDLDPDTMEPAELRKKLTEMFRPFAAVLHDWNVIGDDDEPVPANLHGLLEQEVPFIAMIIEAYVSALSQAPPPLPSSSPGAGISPEAAAALASQSASPGSSPAPS